MGILDPNFAFFDRSFMTKRFSGSPTFKETDNRPHGHSLARTFTYLSLGLQCLECYNL